MTEQFTELVAIARDQKYGLESLPGHPVLGGQ